MNRLVSVLIATSLLALPAAAAPPPIRLTLESRATLAPPYVKTPDAFGGISGADYDRAGRRWYLISDDTSQRAPARLYSVRIRFGAQPKVTIDQTITLTDERGRSFPVSGSGGESVDGEALRFDPASRMLIWTSEGAFLSGIGPSVWRSDVQGRQTIRMPLPPMFDHDPAQKRGPRGNKAFEGLDLTPDGGIWLAMESPLLQDGEIPSPTAGAIARLTRLNSDGTVAAQYAYAIDRITRAEPGKQSDNGISEMLALDDGRLLILERSGLQDVGTRYNFDCRLYLVDLDGATDVSTMDSLNDQTFTPASKTLLLDLNTLLGSNAGNLESMAWATRGLNPRGRLVLFTDDNFDAGRPTQMVVLRVGR